MEHLPCLQVSGVSKLSNNHAFQMLTIFLMLNSLKITYLFCSSQICLLSNKTWYIQLCEKVLPVIGLTYNKSHVNTFVSDSTNPHTCNININNNSQQPTADIKL